MIRIKQKFSGAEAVITDEQWAILVRKDWAKKYTIINKNAEAIVKKGNFVPPEIKVVTAKKIDGLLPAELPVRKRKPSN